VTLDALNLEALSQPKDDIQAAVTESDTTKFVETNLSITLLIAIPLAIVLIISLIFLILKAKCCAKGREIA
jgi:hypothetical protein